MMNTTNNHHHQPTSPNTSSSQGTTNTNTTSSSSNNTTFLSDSLIGSSTQDYSSNNPSINFWQSNNNNTNTTSSSSSSGFNAPLSFTNYSPLGQQSYNTTTGKLVNQFQSASFRSIDADSNPLAVPPLTGHSAASMMTNNSSGTNATSNPRNPKYSKQATTAVAATAAAATAVAGSSSSLMNINAPSYVPNNYTTNYGSNTGNVNSIINNPTSPNNNSNDKYKYYYNTANANVNSIVMNNKKMVDSDDNLQEEYHKLKIELILKNQIIKNLTDQINLMNKQKTSIEESFNNNNNNLNGIFKIPKNHYQLFQDLSKTLQEKSIDLEETKDRLEAVLVALTCDGNNNNNNNNNTGGGGVSSSSSGYTFDVEELSHKLINKLCLLSEENENLLKMISYGNKTSLLIEIGLLRHELETLKKK
ncbi:MUM2 [[Candida] subhashii]|uniref:MUM2 n=1 Tax=[Candida] subhashii TaxID=561895 RepID=A0A8J5QF00_9ASCO|nr:MUM2 [[Candida] subhashii]KAG7660894.1 MUM2 [[Candida] subhashii]